MVVVSRHLAALVLAISGLGLALYGALVDASTTISCTPLPQGVICQAVLVKEVGWSLAILGAIIFLVGLVLFTAWKRRPRTQSQFPINTASDVCLKSGVSRHDLGFPAPHPIFGKMVNSVEIIQWLRSPR